jgi:hypothetical protein
MTSADDSAPKASENPRWAAVSTDHAALEAWRRRSAEAFGPRNPGPRAAEAELAAYIEAAQRLFSSHDSELRTRADKILEQVDLVRAKGERELAIVSWKDHFSDVMFHHDPPPPAPDGWFWWAQTQATGNAGISQVFLSDGLHFFGRIDYDADPLIHRFTGAIATFELHANRRPPSAIGRWRSMPFVDLSGQIKAFTGVKMFPLAMDDKWAKCRLVLRQTAFQLLAGGPVVLANQVTVTSLLDEENNARWNFRNLDGFTPMPMVEFGVADPNASVFVDLDVRFDIDLEGNSAICFVPGDNPMGSVLLQHHQWQVHTM